jgi:hypothetical protein
MEIPVWQGNKGADEMERRRSTEINADQKSRVHRRSSAA